MSGNQVAHSFTRHLPLEGGCNFRDVGGYHAEDGRVVRWGRVYRAGVLSYLTPADHDRLRQLGIGGIYDLRRANERHHEPTRWCDTTLTPFVWDDGHEPPSVTRFFYDQEDSAQGMRAAMLDLYRSLPNWLAPRIRPLLQSLCADASPVLVHCSAGKDRTGLVIAVLLSALGVSREQVMHDYLLTNELAQLEEFMTSRKFALLGVTDAEHPLLLMPADKRRALLSADPDYLDAAFVQLDRDYGSLDAYLLHAVGLTTDARRQLCAMLLQMP
jgi:protein-tyrosine phosphatase